MAAFVPSLKPDAEEYVASMERHGASSLFHYTPLENVPRILKAGALLSRREQAIRKAPSVKIHFWGEGFLHLEDYICLCFLPPLGVLKREKGAMAVLEVAPEVVSWEETCFCPRNSASPQIAPDEIQSRTDLPSLEALFTRPELPGLRNRSSEVLVRGTIPLRYVREIRFPSRDDLRAVRGWKWRIILSRLWMGSERLPRFGWDQDGRFFP